MAKAADRGKICCADVSRGYNAVKAIIFDFDGTLLDSSARHTILLRDVCEELKTPLTETQYNSYLAYKRDGYSTKKYLIQICKMPELMAEKCAELWRERIEWWSYLKCDAVYSDSRETLKNLSKEFDLYLLSARKNEEFLYQQLREVELVTFFQKIYCVSPAGAGERKGEVARAVENVTCVVGDTEVDHAAAVHAGCAFYALNRGFRSKKFWDALNVRSYPNLGALPSVYRG